ncbi:MAG: DciA family protein [Synergistes sp.]|nr:DciA family protein [Synergistes sp.]
MERVYADMRKHKDPASAAEVMNRAASASRGTDNWAQIAISLKLSELAENWQSFAGPALARKSMPSSFSCGKEEMTLTVNVTDHAVLTSARFRTAQLRRNVSAFFGTDVKIEMKVGAVKYLSHAKPPLPAYKRRAPIVLNEDDIRDESEKFKTFGVSSDLADKMARVKLSLEKIIQRRQ